MTYSLPIITHFFAQQLLYTLQRSSVCKGRPGITPQTKYSGSGTGCLHSGMVGSGEGGEHLALPLHFQWAKEITTDPVDLLADVSAGTTRVCFREWALGWKCLPPYAQEKCAEVPRCSPTRSFAQRIWKTREVAAEKRLPGTWRLYPAVSCSALGVLGLIYLLTVVESCFCLVILL